MTKKMKRMKKETHLSSKTIVHGTYYNEALLAQAYQEPQRITTRPTNNEIPSWSISLIHLHSFSANGAPVCTHVPYIHNSINASLVLGRNTIQAESA